MRRGLAAAACALLLAGCGSSSLTPAQELQDQTAALVDDANGKNASGLQSSVDTLRQTITQQQQAGQISEGRAAQLKRLLAAIESHKDELTTPPVVSPSATTPPPTTAAPTTSPPTPTPTQPTSPPTTRPTTPPPTTKPPATSAPPTIKVGVGGKPTPS